MKTLQQHIEEKLIITTKNKTNTSSKDIINLLKRIRDGENFNISADWIETNIFWWDDLQRETLTLTKMAELANELYYDIHQYDYTNWVTYHARASQLKKVKENNAIVLNIIKIANENQLSTVMYESSDVSKNNRGIQIIKIEDDNLVIFAVGNTIFKNNEFIEPDKISSFRIVYGYK